MLKTKKIKIGYRNYRVVTNSDLLAEVYAAARVHNPTQVIEYSTNYPPSEIVDSLIHEVLHAVWDLHINKEKAREEEAVTLLAHGLTQVFKDNPKFITELLEHVRKEGP